MCKSSLDRVYEPEICRSRGDILANEESHNARKSALSDYRTAEALAASQDSKMWQLRAQLRQEKIVDAREERAKILSRIELICDRVYSESTDADLVAARKLSVLTPAETK